MNEFEQKLINELQRIRIIMEEWSGVHFEDERKPDVTGKEDEVNE